MVEQRHLVFEEPRSPGFAFIGRALWQWWSWLQGVPRRDVLARDNVGRGGAQEPPKPDIAVARLLPRPSRQNSTSSIVAAFDSAHPVRRLENLHGRNDKLESLREAVLFGRQHAIIHGARGSGKTSLSQVFGDQADQQGAVVIYTACEPRASFADLVRPYITSLPDACVSIADKDEFNTQKNAMSEDVGPREIVDFLSVLAEDCQVILIFDEFDRVTASDVNDQISTFMKLLSDARLSVQIILVGIARTVDEIITAHPSLRRHLVPIPIGRISSQDVITLIETGAARANLRFSEESKAEIAAVSCGSPYHAQLFCYVAAIEAARCQQDEIDLERTRIGMRRAFETWSTLNSDDAALFRTLASGTAEEVAAVREAALEAATHDCLSNDSRGVDLLGPALRQDGGAARYYFRDSAAPQLLLALLAGRSEARRAPVTGLG